MLYKKLSKILTNRKDFKEMMHVFLVYVIEFIEKECAKLKDQEESFTCKEIKKSAKEKLNKV